MLRSIFLHLKCNKTEEKIALNGKVIDLNPCHFSFSTEKSQGSASFCDNIVKYAQISSVLLK